MDQVRQDGCWSWALSAKRSENLCRNLQWDQYGLATQKPLALASCHAVLTNTGRVRLPNDRFFSMGGVILSGGFFEYRQFLLEDMAGEIDKLIARNGAPTEYEDAFDLRYLPSRHYEYPADILARFRESAHELRRVGEMAHRVDWLVSGDDGEDTFRERWSDEVRSRFVPEEESSRG